MRLLLCLSTFVFLGLLAAPRQAQAQATRTWVSGLGDDANPCSRTAPCKTFAGAISKTSSGGAINCLDPGGFGGVTITKSVSIVCNTTEGGVLVSGTPGVVVTVGTSDLVLLDGLDIDGVGAGTMGVRMTGAGTLIIRRSSIKNFSATGLDVTGLANTIVIVEDSYISRNMTGGAHVAGTGGVANYLFLKNTSLTSNGNAGVQLGAAAALYITGSTVVGSPLAIDSSGGGTTTSFGNNTLLPPPTINTTQPQR